MPISLKINSLVKSGGWKKVLCCRRNFEENERDCLERKFLLKSPQAQEEIKMVKYHEER
jgi:hypothetical protein